MARNFYNLTYEDCQEICKKYDNFNFSEHQFRIRGFKVSTFDYFICGFNDFNAPLPSKPDVKAFDMRGITFVFNKDGSLWKRFLMLPKFFNLNEVEETQYNNIKDKKVYHTSIKEDGSLVTFMMTPDGELFSKTIRGFDNEQAVDSLKLLKTNPNHVNWVKDMINFGFTPLFEFVSLKNRIVIKYSANPELRLIGLRDNETGSFLPASKMDNMTIWNDIKIVPEVKEPLEILIKKAKVEEYKEGWVIIFADGLMIKIKTEWYFNLHGIRTENIFREDYVIKNYYEKTLDDVKAQLDPKEDEDAFKFINLVTNAIDNYAKDIDCTTLKLYNIWKDDFKGDWSKFATKHHKDKFFKFVQFYEDKEFYNKRKIEHILHVTYRLQRAREIVEKYKL